MPHLETAGELAQALRTERIPASEVREGDVLIGQGRIVLVSKIEHIETPSQEHCFLVFDEEPVPGDRDGYLRSITLKPSETATIVSRRCLA